MFFSQLVSCCRNWAVHRRIAFVPLSAVLVLSGGCEESATLDPRATTTIGMLITYADHHQPIEPLPADPVPWTDKSRLGKLLFHDTRLSHDNTISCASCHEIANGGDDGRAFALGIGGAVGGRNSPTVLNASLNLAQFWDGRASNLEAQVAGPIHADNEMGSKWDEVIAKLNGDPELKARFGQLYPDGITAKSITECIVSYEELLITPHAPFDEYLRGNTAAVSQEVVEGYRLFRELGCAACHQGRAVGGNLLENFGVMREFFENSSDPLASLTADARLTASSGYSDSRRFKVPMLRNVELTGPYLHDGSAETLEDAIGVMGNYQLGADISEREVQLLIAFLRSLTGQLSEDLK